MLRRFALVLLFVFILPANVLSQELPEMPPQDAENFSVEEWNEYGMTVLEIIFPNDDLSEIVIYAYVKDDDLRAGIFEDGSIAFASGLARFLNNKYEFAVVLTHEYAHLLFGFNEEFSYLEHELQADEFMVTSLPARWKAPCVAASFLHRHNEASLDRFPNILRSHLEDVRKRVGLFNRACYLQNHPELTNSGRIQ